MSTGCSQGSELRAHNSDRSKGWKTRACKAGKDPEKMSVGRRGCEGETGRSILPPGEGREVVGSEVGTNRGCTLDTEPARWGTGKEAVILL